MAIFALAAVAASAVLGKKAESKQRKAQRNANEAIRLQNLRQRQQFLKQVRLARAQALVQGVAQGAGGLESSGSQGVQASLRSQQIGTEDFIAEQLRLGGEVAKGTEQASRLASLGNLLGTAAQIGRAAAPLIPNRPTPPSNVNQSPFTQQ